MSVVWRPKGIERTKLVCWLNSSLQFLAAVKWPIRFKQYCENQTDLISGIFRLVFELQKTEGPRNIKAAKVNQEAKAIIRYVNELKQEARRNMAQDEKSDPDWTLAVEQDAQECMSYILNMLHDLHDPRARNLWNRDETWQAHQADVKEFLQQQMSYLTQTVLHCERTGTEQVVDQIPGYMLRVDLPAGHRRHSIQQLVANCNKAEHVQDYRCFCGQKHTIKKQMEFITLPQKYLLIHLKRFKQTETGALKKISCPVLFGRELQLVTASNEPRSYRVVCVINHRGETISGGHYTVTTKSDDAMFHCNDDLVQETHSWNVTQSYLVLLEATGQQEEQKQKHVAVQEVMNVDESPSPPHPPPPATTAAVPTTSTSPPHATTINAQIPQQQQQQDADDSDHEEQKDQDELVAGDLLADDDVHRVSTYIKPFAPTKLLLFLYHETDVPNYTAGDFEREFGDLIEDDTELDKLKTKVSNWLKNTAAMDSETDTDDAQEMSQSESETEQQHVATLNEKQQHAKKTQFVSTELKSQVVTRKMRHRKAAGTRRRWQDRETDDSSETDSAEPPVKQQRTRPVPRGRRKGQRRGKPIGRATRYLRKKAQREYKRRRREAGVAKEDVTTNLALHLLSVQKKTDKWWSIARESLEDYTIRAEEKGEQPQKYYLVGKFGDVTCKWCKALKLKHEKGLKGNCCKEGKLKMEYYDWCFQWHKKYPELYQLLMNPQSEASELFRKYSWVFNQCFQLCQQKMKKKRPGGQAQPTFQVQGRMVTWIAAAPNKDIDEGDAAHTHLIYNMTDPEEQRKMRLMVMYNKAPNQVPKEDENKLMAVFRVIQKCIDKNNQLVKKVQSIFDYIKDHDLQEYHLALCDATAPTSHFHHKVTDLPEGSRPAVLVNVEARKPNEQKPSFNELIFTNKQGQTTIVNENNPYYDAVLFPVLLPGGDATWSYVDWNLKDPNTGKYKYHVKVTVRKYMRFLLYQRTGIFNPLHHLRSLYEHFISVQWARADQINLNSAKTEVVQKRIQGDVDMSKRNVLLTSRIRGSKRFLMQQAKNAMAICRTLHVKPTLFITFTCNPNWPEIVDNIPENDTAEMHPVLVQRVFRAKFEEIKQDILKKEVLGRVIAYCWVQEWQKRNLPHIHMLLCLHPEDVDSYGHSKLEADGFASAEIPDPELCPEAHRLVMEFMIHTPCVLRQSCLRNGACIKGFPYAETAETIFPMNEYVHLKRRLPPTPHAHVGLHNWRQKKIKVNNEYVIPYNLWFLTKYHCHFNVLQCYNVKAFRYLYKYLLKGPDYVVAMLRELHKKRKDKGRWDETEEYVMLRHFGSFEAACNLLEHRRYDMSPPVEELPIHVPDCEWRKGKKKDSQLEGYFTLIREEREMKLDSLPRAEQEQYLGLYPQRDEAYPWSDEEEEKAEQRPAVAREDRKLLPPACELFYHQLPMLYNWQKNKWQRKRFKNQPKIRIGRICHNDPSHGEVYYVRTLLNHVKDVASYEELRTVPKLDSAGKRTGRVVVCDTFQQACQKRQLFKGDEQFRAVLAEAKDDISAKQLRKMLAMIFDNNDLVDPLSLFKSCYFELSHDFRRQYNKHHKQLVNRLNNLELEGYILNETLAGLEQYLSKKGQAKSTLEYYGFPPVEIHKLKVQVDRSVAERVQLDFDQEAEKKTYEDNVSKMTAEQKAIFDRVKQLFENCQTQGGDQGFWAAEKQCIFIKALAGAGKTFVFRTIAHYFRSINQICLCMALSGIAATLFDKGMTMHHGFGVPLMIDEHTVPAMKPESAAGSLLRQAAVIMIDEVSMCHKDQLDYVDKTLRIVCNNPDVPFGGKLLLVSGDFRQLPPVIRGATWHFTVMNTIQNSKLYPEFEILQLTHNKRLQLYLDELDEKLKTNQITRQEYDALRAAQVRFENWLNEVGNGTAEYFNNTHYNRNCGPFATVVPTEYIFDRGEDAEALVDAIFANLDQNITKVNWLKDRCILTPKNTGVDHINSICEEKLLKSGAKFHDYVAKEWLDESDGKSDWLQPEELEVLEFAGMPKHYMRLCVNEPVMLLRNMNVATGLCNGTRLQIVECCKNFIKVRRMFGDTKEVIALPPIKFKPTPDETHIPLIRLQNPVRASFAFTCTKGQGQTMRTVGLYLPKPCFEHGMFYCAVSRTTNPALLKIMIQPAVGEQGFHSQTKKWFTQNVIFDALISDDTEENEHRERRERYRQTMDDQASKKWKQNQVGPLQERLKQYAAQVKQREEQRKAEAKKTAEELMMSVDEDEESESDSEYMEEQEIDSDDL